MTPQRTILLLSIHLAVDAVIIISGAESSISVTGVVVSSLAFGIVCGQFLLITIWLALGREPLVLRFAVWGTTLVVLLCMFSAHWLISAPPDWGHLKWVSYFGFCSGARLLFIAPGILLTVAMPLWIAGKKLRNPATKKLTLRALLLAVGYLSVALGLLMAVSPNRFWSTQLIPQAVEFAGDPAEFSIFVVMPSLVYSLVAFVSIWFARCVTQRWRKVILVSLVVASTLAVIEHAWGSTMMHLFHPEWVRSKSLALTLLSVAFTALSHLVALLTVGLTLTALKGLLCRETVEE